LAPGAGARHEVRPQRVEHNRERRGSARL
jgi:hypothetical protein